MMHPCLCRGRAWFFAGATLLLVQTACQPKRPHVLVARPEGPAAASAPTATGAQETAARSMAGQAQQAETQGDKGQAEKLRDTVTRDYPATLAAAEMFEARATAAMAAGKTAEAALMYEHLLFYRPNFARIAPAQNKYAALLLDLRRYEEAEKILARLYDNSPSTDERWRVGSLLATAHRDAGHVDAAVRILVTLHNLPGLDAEARKSASDRTTQMVASDLNLQEAQRLWDGGAKDPAWDFFRPMLGFKLAKIYYHVGEFGRAESLLTYLTELPSKDPYADAARTFLARLQARFEVDAKVVGVVLPLSGRFSQYGERSLRAIELGLGGAHSPVKLVVKDSQGEPTVAAAAVESLVLQSHAIAVIGPMFSTEALAAALKAEELSVPLIALSHREGLPEVGPYIFRTALTIQAQAQALAKVAFEKLGFHRFALMYPKSRYGLDFINAFWDEVDRRKGEIRGVEAYEPDQTTFREPVRRLVGRWRLNSRPDFREALEALKEQKLPPMRLRAEIEKLDKTFPPVVDFDAIIIPDSGREIGLIAPALAFEDIVLTHDSKALERIRRATKQADVHPVTLMGASTWNNSQTIDSCENYCEDAVFVDAYFPNSTDPRVRDFVTGFRQAYNGADPYLSEAQAFDTAGLIKEVLRLQKPVNRKAMRDALQNSPPYAGITGKMTFDNNGDATKDLFVLTIKAHTIRLYDNTHSPAG